MNYYEKIIYWYAQNIGEPVPDFDEIVTMIDHGAGVEFEWKIQNPPSKVTLDAIDETTARDWVEADRLSKAVDYDNWDEKMRKAFKLMVKEINKLRANAGLPTYDKQQVMDALKGE